MLGPFLPLEDLYEPTDVSPQQCNPLRSIARHGGVIEWKHRLRAISQGSSVNFAQAFSRQDPAQRNLPERDDDLRIEHAELRIEPGRTGRNLSLRRRSIAAWQYAFDWPTFDDVCDVDIVTAQPDIIE